MVYVSTLTSKGQATIPLEIRSMLGLELKEKVAFVVSDGQVVIQPAKSFLSLMGSVSAKSKVSDREFDRQIMSAISREFRKQDRVTKKPTT